MKRKKLVFPPAKKETLLKYFRELTCTQGQGVGKALKVFSWEREFLRHAFKRDVHDASLTIARGAGKTTFVSAIADAALEGPLAQPRAGTVIVASSFDQARIDFEHAMAFLEQKHEDLRSNKRRWKIQDSANRASITDTTTGARIKCIGSDPARAHGLAAALYILDEPAQWPRNFRDRMYAAIRTARGKIPNSKLIALGTQSNDKSHWFQKLILTAGYSATYAAPAGCDPFDEVNWHLANPSRGCTQVGTMSIR